jgi:hypothetical protein
MSTLNCTRILGKFAVAALLLAAAGAWAQTENLTVVFSKPDASLGQYEQFLLLPLNLGGTRLIPPPWVENPDPREWELTEDNREFLTAAYASAVREGIEAGGEFKVVSEPAPGTLQLEVRLISLTPWAARGEEVETRGSGTLTFEAQVRDAQTAELLAIYEGTQQVGQDYQENTDFNKRTDVTEHFTNWGRNISRRLAEAQAQ